MPSAAGLFLFEGVSAQGCTLLCTSSVFQTEGECVLLQTFPRLSVIFYLTSVALKACVCTCVSAYTFFYEMDYFLRDVYHS